MSDACNRAHERLVYLTVRYRDFSKLANPSRCFRYPTEAIQKPLVMTRLQRRSKGNSRPGKVHALNRCETQVRRIRFMNRLRPLLQGESDISTTPMKHKQEALYETMRRRRLSVLLDILPSWSLWWSELVSDDDRSLRSPVR